MENPIIETIESTEDDPDNSCSSDIDHLEDLPDPPELANVRLGKVKLKELETFTRSAIMFGWTKRERMRKELKRDKLKLLVEVQSINKKLAALDMIDVKRKSKKDS